MQAVPLRRPHADEFETGTGVSRCLMGVAYRSSFRGIYVNSLEDLDRLLDGRHG